MIRLLVGLGNPGTEHAQQRHNVGFWLLDQLANNKRASWTKERGFQSQLARAKFGEHDVWLVKPQTYMNRSGAAVQAIANFYKITTAEILVVHDDLDLPAGHCKLKQGGGHAGHNGLRDLHAMLPDENYWRLRIGIGHPGHKSQVVGWVLNRPSSTEQEAIESALTRCEQVLDQVIAGEFITAMNSLHAQNPKPSASTSML